ncbi:MAG: glycosyl hydrolase family 5 [Rhodospirillaceae bacterium]|nr:glycosyl hydrolase family 5 [Rhodospirillaceae bacterium]|tara:strand:+ start:16941 stop:17345 length:405 start_codon:yes stop_codon:yes gene_type:complete
MLTIKSKQGFLWTVFALVCLSNGGVFASDGAVLQGLDKVTARIQTFNAPIDKPVRFGSLRVRVRTCVKRPPEEPPESAAFLEISDERPGEEEKRVFSGWMFASSPALSAMEHAVYDVWVVDCMKDSSAETSNSP